MTYLTVLRKVPARQWHSRSTSSSSAMKASHSCRLLVVGGGSGGCSIAAKFARKLGKESVIVIEPSSKHYYQPMWTMVGGGMKTLEQSCRPMQQVLPTKARWIHNKVVEFDPKKNKVRTEAGDDISYDFMVVAMGMQTNWDEVKGLRKALETPGVSSNYLPSSAPKTFRNMQEFTEGNAIFTFPNTPIKCPGAPQKIMYITDQYFRKTGKRDKANIVYNTSLPVLFGVEKYARSLWKLVEQRNITVNTRRNLVEVRPQSKEAVFQNLDKPEETVVQKYAMLHVSPPMSAPDVLRSCQELVDAAGYVDVDKDTLQHLRFPNVFAIGDCSNLPTSKTAAAVAAESGVLSVNLSAVMAGGTPTAVYDGYTSCPLVTGYSKTILAEFKYGGVPLETFPVDQGKERRLAFLLKRDIMPLLYWQLMLRGYWNGPGFYRKLMHLGFSQ